MDKLSLMVGVWLSKTNFSNLTVLQRLLSTFSEFYLYGKSSPRIVLASPTAPEVVLLMGQKPTHWVPGTSLQDTIGYINFPSAATHA